MKRIVMLAGAVALAGVVCGADSNEVRRLRRSGGMITRPAAGVFFVFDGQKKIGGETVNSALGTFCRPLRIASQRHELAVPFALADAAKILAAKKATSAVFVIDDETLPVSLVAPEDKWGFVNVAKLSTDNPDAEKLNIRYEKEFARVSAIVLGAWTTPSLISVLQPTARFSDIDGIGSTSITPETLPSLLNYTGKIGFTPLKTVPYRLACKQGWAPPPTNEYQKAVWDEVHAVPEKPLKITDDTDKQKAVVK